MNETKKVRKFSFQGDTVCIADELLSYIGAKNNIEHIINDKQMQKGYDFEIIPSYILNNKISISKYKDRTSIILLKANGILKLLNNRRQTESIDVARLFGLKLNFIKEREYLNIIKAAFSDYTCIQQYHVQKDNSKGYFIDLYIYGKDKNVAVEVDENGHSSYDDLFEKERESYIRGVLGCDFIRFNPDDKNFNIGQVIHKIMKTKSTTIKTHFKYIDFEPFIVNTLNDLLEEVNLKDLKIIDFIENLQIENIHHDLGLKLSLKKTLDTESNFIVLLDEKPILNTKDIILETITLKDNYYILTIVVKYNNKHINKDIEIAFEFYNDNLEIKLLNGYKKNSYIKDYIDSLDKQFQFNEQIVK